VPANQSEKEALPPAPMVPVIPNKTTVPTPLPALPLQKEFLVSTSTDDAPKAPDLTKCEDPMKVVQKYKAYFRIQNQRYQEGMRPKPPTFKATMPATWLESFLSSGCYKKPIGEKWSYDAKDDEELFKMYLSRCKTTEPKRPSTFLREFNLSWMKRGTCRNAADNILTSTHQAFRDQSDFIGQLSKSGGNADLIEYISKEVVTNKVLRERLLKGIAEELPMKKDFEVFSDFLRDEADDMDAEGRPNEACDQVASGHAAGSAGRFSARGRGQFIPQT